MRSVLGAGIVAGLLAVTPVCAQDSGAPQQPTDHKACDVRADLLNVGDMTLEKVAAAVRERKALEVLVIGSGSSSIVSPDGAQVAYPARLEAYLREKLPGVAVTVATSLQPKRTAEEVVEAMPGL